LAEAYGAEVLKDDVVLDRHNDLIESARSVRIEDEVARLRLQLKRVGQSEFVGSCPRCGGRDRFGVNTRKQVWNCRGCGRGGDVIDLVQLAAGVDFLEAVRELAGERPRGPLQRSADLVSGDSHGTRAATASKDDDASKIEIALRLWEEGHGIEGTLAEHYLRQVRGLELPDDLSRRVLRFHPACWFDGVKHPCLVALWRSIDRDAPSAITRTALAADGSKIGRKALGRIAGAAIKLSADEDVTHGLTIGEGLETVLAGMAEGFPPAWVVGLPGIVKFPVLAGVDCLTILVDNDNPDRNGRRAGPAAARECSERWTAAGREVRRIVPHALGADMADLRRAL
jgi:hypothetical protein